MPDISLRIQVGDVVEVVQAIESQLADPTVLMVDSLLFMIRATQQRFEAQGPGWAALAQSTIEALKGANDRSLSGKKAVAAQNAYFAAAGSIQILRDTGRLLMSVGGGQSGAFEDEQGFGESDQFTATLGTNHPGAEALQFVIAGGRPFLIFDDQVEDDIMDASVQFVMATGPYAE